MKSNNRIDPVIIITVGVVFVAVALALAMGQPAADGHDMTSRLMFVFITGLTTGGLSCMAVQGGLLASSLARQIEEDVAGQHQGGKKSKHVSIKTNSALPIFLFLLAKLIVYTLLGAALGALGSVFKFNPMLNAMLMILIGLFMIGNALRMFNVHPIFRYFTIEPPKFVTRYIRKTAKGTDTFTPLFLGALTVFIPCGITQIMMADALATGSAVTGAALMFAFTLGTSPVFFALAWLTTELGSKLEKFFMRFVAAVVLILGFVTLNGGLNVIGSPLSLQNLTRTMIPVNEPIAQPTQIPAKEGEITLYVQNGGYFPARLKAPAGKELTLNIVSDGVYSCALDFLIPELDYHQQLPSQGIVQVSIPAKSKDETLFFTCSMGMYTGEIVFE